MTNELVTVQAQPAESFFLTPAVAVESALSVYQAKKEFIEAVLKKDVDYGVVPGTSQKPTLLKPGAEKMASFFALAPRFIDIEKVEDWTGTEHGGEAFFYYRIRCQLSRNGMVIGEADGSCNSWETKYRYRWVKETDVPDHLDHAMIPHRDGAISEFAFAIDKAETSGQYGKPAEYWQRFKDAIMAGTAVRSERPTKGGKNLPAWTIGTTLYRVPNGDVAEVVNTILKMAQKRALVAATLIATNVSDFFTQDIEDYTDQSYEPPVHTHTVTTSESTPPKGTDWKKQVAAAATVAAVKEIANAAQDEIGYMPDDLLDLCMKREKELTPKPRTAPAARPQTQQTAPQTAPASKAPSWNGGPDEKTAYTLAKLKTADGETIATIAKLITPAVVGEENYRKIQQAMTAREKELYPPQQEVDTDPFASDVPPEIQGLTMMLESKSTAADFDDVARRWSEDSHSIDEPTYNRGVELIQEARVRKGV